MVKKNLQVKKKPDTTMSNGSLTWQLLNVDIDSYDVISIIKRQEPGDNELEAGLTCTQTLSKTTIPFP
ncbi:hypothetical protein HispidOSU_025449 [Sigmodon hispidus]